MNIISENDLALYTEIKSLYGKEHIKLIQKDDKYFVKKSFKHCDISIYQELSKLNINGIPKIEGIYLTEEQAVIIEEYIEGVTIEEYMLKNGVFPEQEAIDIIQQLCSILKIFHANKPAIIHRDIKPSNIILTPDKRVVLIDFDGAKFEKSYETRDTVLMGTVGYAAPEQYGFGSSTPQTDIYGIGILMNYMLTGQLPTDKLYKKRLKTVIKRCVELNPKDRFQTVSALFKELNRYTPLYNPWLPPGFRSKNILKMLVACAGYISITYLSWETDVEFLMKVSLKISFLIIILFYCNYMNIRLHFPLMKSSSRVVRVIGYIINPLIITGFFIFSEALLTVFVNSCKFG